MAGTILWWGRFDPEYSRNRIIRNILLKCGYRLEDFRPRSSLLGTFEAFFTRPGKPDAVWVPAFRQRDFPAARRFADKYNIPLIFDPLISSWDKVVFERQKYPDKSSKGDKLHRWEKSLFTRADLVLADTPQHARFFIERLAASESTTRVVPVGAEENIFKPCPARHQDLRKPLEILFYGSFISLQGPEVIVKAAARVREANWTMLGDGPLRSLCERESKGIDNLCFENWLPYERLGERIGEADVLLGIFGSSDKSARVIPNKAYQALACSRPLVTRESKAYPAELGNDMANGITFIPPADADALCTAVQRMLDNRENLADWGQGAYRTYQNWFSRERIKQALQDSLALIGL